mgnify:CR=1 FL=1
MSTIKNKFFVCCISFTCDLQVAERTLALYTFIIIDLTLHIIILSRCKQVTKLTYSVFACAGIRLYFTCTFCVCRIKNNGWMYSKADRPKYHKTSREIAAVGAGLWTPDTTFRLGHNHKGFPATDSMAHVIERRHRPTEQRQWKRQT